MKGGQAVFTAVRVPNIACNPAECMRLFSGGDVISRELGHRYKCLRSRTVRGVHGFALQGVCGPEHL